MADSQRLSDSEDSAPRTPPRPSSSEEEVATQQQVEMPHHGELPLTLKVRDQSGDEMFFKVKMSTHLSKIFEAYANRRGLSLATLRFMIEGKRLTGEDTPKLLELEEDDQIDVVLEQTGGYLQTFN